MNGHKEPSWPDNLIFICDETQLLEIEVWNYLGNHTNHDFMGVAYLAINQLYSEETIDLFFE